MFLLITKTALVYLTGPVILEDLSKFYYFHLTNPTGHQVHSKYLWRGGGGTTLSEITSPGKNNQHIFLLIFQWTRLPMGLKALPCPVLKETSLMMKIAVATITIIITRGLTMDLPVRLHQNHLSCQEPQLLQQLQLLLQQQQLQQQQ